MQLYDKFVSICCCDAHRRSNLYYRELYNIVIQCYIYNISKMEQASDRPEQDMHTQYKPDPKLLECSLCKLTLQRPTTLACGHSFCTQCLIATISRKISQNKEGRALTMIPLCPRCLSIIWRPLSNLRENVALSALVARFNPGTREQAPPVLLPVQCEAQFHILIDCARVNNTLLPHCFSQVVFATAFIDEIIEQQAQANHVVLRWPGADEGIGIAGRLLRPETYHYMMNASRFETVYKAIFEGKYFVKIIDWQQSDIKVSSAGQYGDNGITTSPLALCQVEETKAQNLIAIEQFRPFFQVYDKLNNPVYLRQVAQLVDERVLHERNNPEKLIYCVMRLLRMSEKEVAELAKSMDDQYRWEKIEDFLVQNASRAAVEVIKIEIPGDYPLALVIALLLLMIVFHYMAK